jgi:hypothetical protein
MNIIDVAIHLIVCQKPDFHRNIEFQSFQKLDLLQISEKKFEAKYASLFYHYFGEGN